MSKANCIDISCYQGSINFTKVKAAGIKYVILRTIRKGLVIDERFEAYYKAARAAGLKVGVYLYTYATSTSYAEKEAAALIEVLAGRKLDLPVWLDMETSTLRKSSASTVQGIANAFRKKITAAGYQCGIYCDADFYKANSHFSGFDSGCEFWIASYGANDGVQHTVPGINHHLFGHQFSSRGKVSGISGYVDVSCVYGVADGTSTSTTTTTGMVGAQKCPYTEPTKTVTSIKQAKLKGCKSYLCKGEGVKWVQWMLNNTGKFRLEVDGQCGTLTVGAITEFQKLHGLTQDGLCGEKTRAMLKKG